MKVPLQKQNSEDAEHPRVTSTYVARRLAGEPRQGRPTNVQPQTETHAAQVSITGKAYEPSAPAKPKTHAVDVKHDVIGTVGSTSSEGNPPNIDLNIPSIRTYGDPISTFILNDSSRFRQTSWNTSISNFNAPAAPSSIASIQLPMNRSNANQGHRPVPGYGTGASGAPVSTQTSGFSGGIGGAPLNPVAPTNNFSSIGHHSNVTGGYGSFGVQGVSSNFGSSGPLASAASGYGSAKEKGLSGSRFGRLAQFGVMGGASSTTGSVLSSNSSSAASNYRGFGANSNPLGAGFGRHKF